MKSQFCPYQSPLPVKASRQLFLLGLFIVSYFSFIPCRGQHTIRSPQIDSVANLISPRRAMMLSAIVPGAGQVYNKKYWKVPLIYTGAGVLGYFIQRNYQEYIMWKQAIAAKRSSNGSYVLDVKKYDPAIYGTIAVMQRYKDHAQRNFELSLMLMAVLYGLNIVDANVDAHLSGFQLGNERLTWSPASKGILEPGLALRFAIK